MAVSAIPEGFHSLTPHLTIHGAAQAIDFYKAAFSATELGRMPGPGGKVGHAMLRIGDSMLMLNDDFPEMDCPAPTPGSAVTLHLYVPDVDAVFAKALAAGGKTVMPVQDMFWGDRYGLIEDPFGQRWAVATHVEDLSQEEISRRGAAAMGGGPK